MRWESFLRVEARHDLSEAATWYEEKRPGLGAEFIDEFLHALDRIESNPETNPLIEEDVRRALLRRFPYGIYYSTEVDHLQIVAILHLHRSPSTWRNRS